MLDQATHEQLSSVYATLSTDYRFITAAGGHDAQQELLDLVTDVAATSAKLHVENRPDRSASPAD